MELILLENILNLGNIGDKVTVKNGYGRNFLLKKGKALRFNKDNQLLVSKRKDELNKKNNEIFNADDKLKIPLKEAREKFEREYLLNQLKKHGGNISKTAKFVGMERTALYRKLKLLGVRDLN